MVACFDVWLHRATIEIIHSNIDRFNLLFHRETAKPSIVFSQKFVTPNIRNLLEICPNVF